MERLVRSEGEKFSVADASQILGLEPFSVYSLVQRRKLNADRTLLGEIVISRTELDRALGDYAEPPGRSREPEP